MPVIYRPSGRALEYSFLALNHYIGCTHGCFYCYVPTMPLFKERDFTNPDVRPDIINRIEKEAPRYAGTNERVLLCFTCDPYQPIDKKEKVTRSVIRVLRKYNIPFQILTKGGLRAKRDFDLYGARDAFATTLTFIKEDDSKKHEPNAATPGNRIKALIEAHSQGIETWVSLEPVIDIRQTLELIEITQNCVDYYKIGKLNHLKSDINWRDFGIEAIRICEKYNKPYYIKDDLAYHLNGIEFTNTDKRLATI